MCILEKLNFKISRGSMPPDPPSELHPSTHDPVVAGPTLNCFCRASYDNNNNNKIKKNKIKKNNNNDNNNNNNNFL